MALSQKQLDKIREDSLEIRDNLAILSITVREQAREIRQIGRRIDRVFDKVADIDLLPEKVTREEFNHILDSIKEINKEARKLRRNQGEE